MTKNYKHYTFQEYFETFSSIQDSYDYYFEMQKEIDKLSEYNSHLIKSIIDCEGLLMQKNNIIDQAKEYLPNIRRSPSYELDEKIDNLEKILDEEIK